MVSAMKFMQSNLALLLLVLVPWGGGGGGKGGGCGGVETAFELQLTGNEMEERIRGLAVM